MKLLKKFAKFLMSPFMVGIVVTVTVALSSVYYYANRDELSGRSKKSLLAQFQEVHEKTIDWRLKDRGLAKGSDQVAILAVDDKSLAAEGRWPWPRDKQAKLIDKAIMYGAKSIAFDIAYSESDNNAALPTLNRLNEVVTNESKLSETLETAFKEELERSDLDKKYSDTIGLYQDQLVLGSFYTEGSLTPTEDACLKAVFERSYPGRYWKKEARPLIITDQVEMKTKWPAGMRENLDAYFGTLELNQIEGWFGLFPSVSKRIDKSLGAFAKDLDPQFYPAIALMVLNEDYERAQATFSQLDPKYGDLETIKSLFTHFSAGLHPHELTKLESVIRNEDREYCVRFMTSFDDLSSLDNHVAKWAPDHKKGDKVDEAIQEQFKTYSWDEALKPQGEVRAPASASQALADFKAQLTTNSITAAVEWSVNIPRLAAATLHTGFFNATQDTDGTIRRVQLIAHSGDHYFPSIAFKSFLLDNDADAVGDVSVYNTGIDREKAKGLRYLKINNTKGDTVLDVPVDQKAQLMINYSGPAHMFPHISASDLLNDAKLMEITVVEYDEKTGHWFNRIKQVEKLEFLKGKQLILGATAIGVFDLRVTPFDENYPGVETHANVLSNLLVERDRAKGVKVDPRAPGFLRFHQAEEKVMWIILLVVGLVLSGLLSYYGAVSGLGITAACLAAIYFVDKYYFFQSGIITTVLFPVSLVSGNYVSLTFYKYFTEERKKQALKGTFEKYVSPSIVAEILSDPENIELGGKKVDLTVMFSDVRGFTTISERLDPRALSDFLNSYLTPMTNIVFENKGTLDKYIGDAIMAFWGAPIQFKDHAHHAARSALKMLEKLKELQKGYEAQNLPPIDIGIGLNSGEVSVGNMGSDTVRSYTVMGDHVNLASRLEGITKKYGVKIVISENTYEHIKDKFFCREVDWVRPKGKNNPVKIYELVSEGPPPEPKATMLKHFMEGYQAYRDRRFIEAVEAFKKAHAADTTDALSEKYIEVCEGYVAEPPPLDWDGVSNMKEK